MRRVPKQSRKGGEGGACTCARSPLGSCLSSSLLPERIDRFRFSPRCHCTSFTTTLEIQRHAYNREGEREREREREMERETREKREGSKKEARERKEKEREHVGCTGRDGLRRSKQHLGSEVDHQAPPTDYLRARRRQERYSRLKDLLQPLHLILGREPERQEERRRRRAQEAPQGSGGPPRDVPFRMGARTRQQALEIK